jgi:hypothetical protein
VGERRRREVRAVVRAQILLGNAAEKGAQEIPGQSAGGLWKIARSAPDYLLDERESGGGYLAEHAITQSKGARLYMPDTRVQSE